MSGGSLYILNETVKFDPIFHNQSRYPQVDSALQLTVTLYILSQLGNSTMLFCERYRLVRVQDTFIDIE